MRLAESCSEVWRRRGAASGLQQGSISTDHERRLLVAGITQPFVVACCKIPRWTETEQEWILEGMLFTQKSVRIRSLPSSPYFWPHLDGSEGSGRPKELDHSLSEARVC
jgi:hypothetical protein